MRSVILRGKMVIPQSRRRGRWTVAAVAGVVAFGFTPIHAQAVTLGEIDVTQAPYNASPTGGADSTAAFQSALNAAAASGAKVRAPAGQYLFSGTITIPAHVVLEGVNFGERSYEGYMNGTTGGDVTASAGTVFLATASSGNSAGTAFVTLNSNSALRNVTIYYPNQPQSTINGWTAPIAYPPSINFTGRNGEIEDVCGVNPYMFIVSNNVGNKIRRVVGQPLYFGINLDYDSDPTGQSGESIEDCRFLATWDSHTAMTNWMKSHSVGYVTYRADEFSMRNCTATGYQNGFSFNSSGYGPSYGALTACSAYNCATAVKITASKAGAGGGIVFEGGAFGNCSDRAVNIANSNVGNVTFNSCRFFNTPGTLATNASGAGSVVSFLGCSFEAWGTSVTAPNTTVPCVYCGDSGNVNGASGKTRMLSCNFDVDQYQYTYTPGEAGVLFKDNSVMNGVRVQVSGVTAPSATGPKYIQINNF